MICVFNCVKPGEDSPCGGNVRVADKRGEDQGPPRVTSNRHLKKPDYIGLFQVMTF